MAAPSPPDRKATLAGLLAILLWASLALMTTLTGDLPPFLVLAGSFGFAGVIGLLRITGQGAAGWRSLRAPWPALLVTGGRSLQVDPAATSGYIAAFAAALTWGGYSVLNRRHADVPSSAIVLPCIAVAVLGYLMHLAFEPRVQPAISQWLVLLVMGAGPVGAAFWLWDTGTKRGDIALLGSLSYLAPLLSTLLLVLAGRAQPHPIQALAIGLLLFGAWLSMRASRAPQPPVAAT